MPLIVRFWRDFVRRYRWWFALGVAFLVATNLLTVAVPWFVERAVNALEAGEGALGGAPWAWAVLVAGVAIVGVRTLSRTLIFNPGRAIEFRVKSALFDHLLRLPPRFFARMRPGEIISRGTDDANNMRALVGFGSLQLFNVVLILLFTLSRMLVMDPWLTLACLVPLTLSALVMRKAVLAMFGYFGQFQAQQARLADRVLESYSGVGVIQAFNAQTGAMDRFEIENRRMLDLGVTLLHIRSWLLPITSVVGSLCVVIVLLVGGRSVVMGELTLGAMAAFTVYVNILVGGINSLGWFIGSVQRGYISLRRIYEVLDEPVGAEDGTPPPDGPLPPVPPEGRRLEVRELSYSHAGQAEPAVRALQFSLAPGRTLGLFGLTGSGKSTVLNLLARVYEPPAGTVFLDGVDVTTISTQAYWGAVAYVPHDAFLFSRGVRENVAVADAEPDPARVAAALADAALTDEIAALPQGADTVVGERGVTLSGGQRQRVALARAFYRDYDILLLDDVLSAVDHATEHALIEAIRRRAAGRSLIVVSNRLGLLAGMNSVLVLDAGRVIDQGTHVELIGRAGPYADAWRLQRAADSLSKGEAAVER